MNSEILLQLRLLISQDASILESIDTDLMEKRMKILAQRARKGFGLLQKLVFVG